MPTRASRPPDSSPQRAFGRDAVVLSLVRVASVGAGFLTSVLAARLLGPEALGAAGVGFTVGTVSALLSNGGLNISTVYFLGRRPAERRQITPVALSMGLVAAAVAGSIVLVGGLLIRSLGGSGVDPALAAATALLAASIVVFELAGSLVLGLDRRGPYIVAQLIEGIGSLLVVAVVLLAFVATAAAYVVAAAGAYLVAAAFALVVAHRTAGGRLLAFDVTYAREALAMGLRGQVGNVLQYLNLRLDLLLVPLLVDLRAAGIYLIAVRLSEAVSMVATASSTLLFQAVAQSDSTHIALTERAMRVTLLLVSGAALVVVVLADVVLATFFGPEFEGGAGALRIMMLAMLPLAVTRLLAGDMKGRGRAGLVSIAAAAAMAATVAADLVLIPLLGIEGAAIASLVAYSTGAVVLLAAFRHATESRLIAMMPTLADVSSLARVSLRAVRQFADPDPPRS